MAEEMRVNYTEYTSPFTGTLLAILLAVNAAAAIVVYPLTAWGAAAWIVMSVWQYLFYRVSKGMAGYKSLLSMMCVVMEKKNKYTEELMLQVDRLEIDQALADDGTKSYKYCLTPHKGDKDEA